MSDEEFSATQSRRGRGRITQDAENRSTALKMVLEGHTQQQVADALQVNQSTVARWLKA